MAERHISKEKINEWLDDEILLDIEEIEPPDDELFMIKVVTNNWEIGISKTRDDGPIIISSFLGPPPEVKGHLIDSDFERRNLQMRLELLLTNMPGFFYYVDEKGEPTDKILNMDQIILQKRIYPDGACQNSLMNAILDISARKRYIKNIIDLYMENIDTNR